MEYFVGEAYIRKFINANVDWSLLKPLVKDSALIYLRPLLGFRFFDDLLTKYNDQTLSPKEEELVEQIKHIQGLRTKYESVLETTYQSSSKGFINQNGDFVSQLTLDELQELKGDLNRKITDVENVMIKWLIFYKDDFPLFEDKINNEIQAPVNNGRANDGENFDII